MPNSNPLLLFQFHDGEGSRHVAAHLDNGAFLLEGVSTILTLAHEALGTGRTLAECAWDRVIDREVDVKALVEKGRLLPPIDHPDPAHLLVTGTGLTHLGSADSRDAMHAATNGKQSDTDSMRMFRMGIEGGKPPAGQAGVQPEWFYKGDGSIVRAPGTALECPSFALDGGEEPELAGIYLNDSNGNPRRLGYVLGNEFSDHVMEQQNYLYLAHSKLRPCSIGPELFVGDLPRKIRGMARIRRGADIVWEEEFLTGEETMSHAIANLVHHHFKYDLFRRPGDLHVHFLGTSTLSFAAGIHLQDGDVMEISAPPFKLPLINTFYDAAVDEADIIHAPPL